MRLPCCKTLLYKILISFKVLLPKKQLNLANTRKLSQATQLLWSISLFLLITISCFIFSEIITYKIVALLLLMTVSIVAMLFDILPVLVTAILSAFVWNFFFIPPIFTFHIGGTEDFLMFLLYFFIAFVNAVLSFKIRNEEKKVRDKEDKEKSIRLYNTLFNSLSHELKTPIATVIGAVDTLKENQQNLSVINQQTLLNEIEIASNRLNRQVENLLNMSRLETGLLKPNYYWCDINELINEVVHKINLNEKQSVVFELDETFPLVKIDRGLMDEVLKNLMHNAVNYAGKTVQIQINVLYNTEKLILQILDNGVGVSPEEMPQLFDKFYRVSQSKTGGSGLGLSIVKGFVEAHGGTVSVKNNHPTGLIFTIEIPAEASFIKNLNHA